MEKYDINKMPNLFLIGAPKAGTSALAAFISQHQSIYSPKLKEPRFFDAQVFYDFPQDYPIAYLADYLKLYDCAEAAKAEYRLDASVFIMYDFAAIEKILELRPDAKFIVVVRDPVSAVTSMFNQRLKYLDPKLREVTDDISKCCELIQKRKNGFEFPVGCRNKFLFRYDLLYSYEMYIPKIKALLKPDQLEVIQYNALKHHPLSVCQEVFDFLNIESFSPETSNVNESFTVQVRYKQLASLCYKLAHLTMPIRSRLKLTGVDFFSRLFVEKKNQPIKIQDNEHEKIRQFFSETYTFLDKQGFTG